MRIFKLLKFRKVDRIYISALLIPSMIHGGVLGVADTSLLTGLIGVIIPFVMFLMLYNYLEHGFEK